MSKINHVVAIRFSVKVAKGWHTKAYGDEAQREAWFAMRSRLFLATLHSSLVMQTTKPDYVFLMMDEGDRDFYNRYLNLKEDFYRPLFSHAEQGHQEMKEALKTYDLKNIAISRVDSDDLIHCQYLEAVQKTIRTAVAHGVPFEYVVAARGYRTDGRRIKSAFFNYSPFITSFSPSYFERSPYGFRHGDVLKHATLVCGQAHWMQFIHGTNLANEMKAVTWWGRLTGHYRATASFERKSKVAEQTLRRQKFYSLESAVNESTWPAGFPHFGPMRSFG